MSRKYVRKTDQIDRERGDLLSLRRQDVEALYAESYPVETRREILDALIGWFAGGKAPKLKNPLADAFLQQLVSRQKEAVRRYIEVCDANRVNVLSSKGERPLPRGNGRSSGVTAVPNINRNKEELDMTKGISNSSDGDGASRVDTAPPTPFSEADAKKFLAMNAPQISTLPGMLNQNGHQTMQCMKFIQDNINDVIDFAGIEIHGRDPEDWDHKSLGEFDDPLIEIAERMEAVGKEGEFRRTLVKALLDSRSGDVKNRAAFVMSRCKRCEEAVKALRARRKASSSGSRG